MRKSFIQILLITLVSLSLFAGENRWTIKGPDAGSPSKIVFDPADSSIVYAATTNGVFRSSDGGQHWTAAAGLLGTSFGDVAVVNGDPQKVFASSVYGLYKSSDRGVTWSLAHPFASFKIAVSTNGSVVYSYAGGNSVIRSSDGGATFGSAGSGLPAATAVTSLVIDPQNADTIYASLLSNAGVYKSTDGAAHWTAANSGLTAPAYYSLAIDPSNGSVLYAGPGPGRLFKTTDGGTSWTELTNGLGTSLYQSIAISTAPPTVIAVSNAGYYKSTDAGSSWTGPSQPSAGTSVAVDPRNASNILIGTFSNLYRSGGSTFAPSASGLTAAYTQAIAVDPRNESIVYTSGAAGIFKSVDHGESWTSLLAGLNQSVVVDPFNSQTLYATTSGTVRRSLNGGATWEDFNTGLPNTSAGVVADPLTPGTLYAIQSAPYKKIGTAAWTIKNSGLPPGTFPSFIAIDPNNASVLYTGGSFGVYKSTNAGDTWTSASTGLSASGAAGITIDRFDSNHLLTWVNSSAFESTNGGATWTLFATTVGHQAILLAFDPTTPGRIYNSSFDAVERSNDGGKTWFSMSAGLGRSHGNIFVISPSGNLLLAGGTDGGVWAFHFARSRAVSH